MAFSPAQRVKLRRYLGYPLSRLDLNFEAKIAGVESQGAEAEAEVVSYLTALANIETQIVQLHDSMLATKIETIEIDPARGMIALYMDGRRWVTQLCAALETTALRDVFSPPTYG